MIARVLVEVEPAHLDRPFDYRVAEGETVRPGSRVEVVFAGRRVRGLVVETADRSEVPDGQLRDIRRVLGPHVWASEQDLDVFRWAAARYAAPVSAVLRHGLPRRVIDVERRAAEQGWFPEGDGSRPEDPSAPEVDAGSWEPYGPSGSSLRAAVSDGMGATYWRPLPGEDLAARVVELVGLALAGGRDVLLVVPEPVSQVADAVRDAYRSLSVDVRGSRGDRALYRAWLEARFGRARVVIGERGVAFWPLARLGLGIVVDEGSPALKERRAPRHHAREVVLERCRRQRAAAVLVGHVPSSSAWRLLAERRVSAVVPSTASERAAAPVVLVDDRSDPRGRGRLGAVATKALREALATGRLGVVLAVRRGEGRAPVCSRCGLRAACPQCDSPLAVLADTGGHGLRPAATCEGCGSDEDVRCVRCGSDRFAPLAAGAARFGSELGRMFPDAQVEVLEGYAREIPDPPAIVVMTRGSALLDAPGQVGAVVLPDIDAQLRRPALDAAEDALRLALRVAAWTASTASPSPGTRRADGVVVVQTREPEHHAVQALVRWDPGGFWRTEATRRAELGFPPAAFAIRLDVAGDGEGVAEDLRAGLPPEDRLLGPRVDGERAAFLVKSHDRLATLDALAPLQISWSEAGLDVRVDVDPVDVS